LAKLDKITDKVKNARGSSGLKWKKHFKHQPKDIECTHCKYTERENSIPKDKFTVKRRDGTLDEIKEITILRGRHDDCMGWTF